MPLVKVLRSRGANVVIEAHGEVLFTPGGDVGRWKRQFSRKVKTFAAEEAPTNKRPRWAHYGAPLKRTFRATTSYDPARMKVHSAVGSTAPHALYVDQGTRGHMAKILPPWSRGDGSLYEASWRPGGKKSGQPPLGEIFVKGIKAQNFFAIGLARAFASEGIPSVLSPTGPSVMDDFPESLAPGAVGWNVAFQSELEQWRKWRDEAWKNSFKYRESRRLAALRRREAAGRSSRRKPTAEEKRRQARDRKRRQRERENRAKEIKKAKPAPKKTGISRSADRAMFIAAMIKKYGRINPDTVEYRNGYWYAIVEVYVTNANGRQVLEAKEVRAQAKS